VCAGLALCSKYSAALTIMGAALFLLTEPTSRRWLARPHPYAAGFVASLVFLPVLVWNAEHGWISFLFQGGRATGQLHPLGPLLNIAGQAVFVLPWIWVPLVWCGALAIRRGPRDSGRWLLVCLAAPPIVVLTVLSLWSNVLFHWTAPGYLMLLPLLGEAVARHWRNSRTIRVWLGATAGLVILGAGLLASEVRFNWPAGVAGEATLDKHPVLDIVDWTSLRTELANRGFLGRPGLVVAATRWLDAGKIDYALGGQIPVICLGPDPRQYGLVARPDDHAGADVLIVAPHTSIERIVGQFRSLFDRIEEIPPATIFHAGRPAMRVPLFIGHRLHKSAGE
jgi:hypothetical protein